MKFADPPLSEEVDVDDFNKVASYSTRFQGNNLLLVAEVNFQSNNNNELAEKSQVENNGLPVYWVLRRVNGQDEPSFDMKYEYNELQLYIIKMLVATHLLNEAAKYGSIDPYVSLIIKAGEKVKREVPDNKEESNEVMNKDQVAMNVSSILKEHLSNVSVDEAIIEKLFQDQGGEIPTTVTINGTEVNVKDVINSEKEIMLGLTGQELIVIAISVGILFGTLMPLFIGILIISAIVSIFGFFF